MDGRCYRRTGPSCVQEHVKAVSPVTYRPAFESNQDPASATEFRTCYRRWDINGNKIIVIIQRSQSWLVCPWFSCHFGPQREVTCVLSPFLPDYCVFRCSSRCRMSEEYLMCLSMSVHLSRFSYIVDNQHYQRHCCATVDTIVLFLERIVAQQLRRVTTVQP